MEVRDDLVNILFQKALWSCREAAVPPCDRETAEKTRISRKALPSTWSINSTVQLMPPKQSDSTDRTLFRRSYRAGFDPDGYRHHRGLRRPLFYKSGYLTCAKCNGVTFIDASALRTVLELKAKVDFGCIPPENLPSCVGCKETLGLRVGAHDFLRFIEGGREALARRRKLEHIAAKMLQRAFRCHLCVQWRKAEVTRQRTIFLLRYRSAQVIQAMLRARLGRRAFETEKWLLVVKSANRLLIKHALNHFPNRRRVFWYKNEAEEEQLYSDYRMLVQRTGYRPPRIVVEQNIREIATRVLEREAELVGRIQSRWRGLIVRRYMIVFRRELKRQRERRAGMALRLQRTVRMWSHRRYADKWRSQRAGERLLTAYLETKNAERSDAACTSGMNRLARAYMTERQEELTARLMGHTNPKLAGGLKMKAFHESPYGNDVVTGLMRDQVEQVIRREKVRKGVDLTRKERTEWVRLRLLEDPQFGMYFQEEVKARNKYVIGKLRSERHAFKDVAATLRDHNRTNGQKYDFPKNINEDPMAVLLERHSTDGQALLKRFSRGHREATN